MSAQKCGYDIESVVPGTQELRFIEVKGWIEGAETVTVTKNETLTGLNKPENFILALVKVPVNPGFTAGDSYTVRELTGSYDVQGGGCVVHYVREPFQREPDWGGAV